MQWPIRENCEKKIAVTARVRGEVNSLGGALCWEWERRGRRRLAGWVADRGRRTQAPGDMKRHHVAEDWCSTAMRAPTSAAKRHQCITNSDERKGNPEKGWGGGGTTTRKKDIWKKPATVIHTRKSGFASVSSLCQDKHSDARRDYVHPFIHQAI